MVRFKKIFKKLIAVSLTMAISLPLFAVSALADSDIKNHWAEKIIREWMNDGLVKGYGDGSFKPENNISRAEFFTMVNKAFGFSGQGQDDEIKGVEEFGFKDLSSESWYYNEVKNAFRAGYITGYLDNTIRPENPITRQEVAVILSKLKDLEESFVGIEGFSDNSKIPLWSKGYIGAAVKAGYMKGYPNGSFNPQAMIKRAEAIVALDNVNQSVVYSKAGTYGPAVGVETIKGNVLIDVEGVILQNIIIKGSLTISERVGQGDATLNNVIVEGETYIKGGGENSIHINGGQYKKIIVQQTASGAVRIVATDADGMEIVISEQAENEKIILEGSFEKVVLEADNVRLQTQGNTDIKNMEIKDGVKDSTIAFNGNTRVEKLVVDAKIDIKGSGTIIEADINADGVTFQKTPTKLNVKDGIEAPSGKDENAGNGGGGSSITKQRISGVLSLSAGSGNVTEAVIQLKKDGETIAEINPEQDGSFRLNNVIPGENYSITGQLNGYYDFSTVSFSVVAGTDINGMNLQLARKEPIITTQNYTTISRGTNGLTVTIDLTSGEDFAEQVINLGHSFNEATVELEASWDIDTGTTGLTLDSINYVNATEVELVFTGTASETRAITIQALAAAIEGSYAYDSNVLCLSVVDDGFMEDADESSDKELYYAVNTDVDDMKGIVVLSHGLAEHLGRYNEIVEYLNAAGYGTYRIDHKGHGRTGEQNADNGIVNSYSEYYEDLDLLVDKAIAENSGKPIYMLGHSMGGLIASMYGVTYTDKLDGQILSGAATGAYYASFGEEAAFYSRFGGNSLFMLPNSLTNTVCRYPAIQNYYYVDPLRLTEFSAQLYWQTFAGGSKYLSDQIADDKYTYPVLIIHGGDDRIVSKAFSQSLYTNIDSADKELKIYDGLFHESLNELNEKSLVIQDIIDWLDARQP